MRRILAIAAVAGFAAVLPGAARAAAAPAANEADAPGTGEEALPPRSQRELVDTLLDRLGRAPDTDSADAIEEAIVRLWLRSGSSTVDILMSRALTAMKDDDYALALDLLNAIVDIKPDYAEGWNKRATLFYLMRDMDRSLADVERTLALEPRHFGALAGLGLILRELGDKPGALAAFRRALAVNPFMPAARDAEKELAEEIEGRGI